MISSSDILNANILIVDDQKFNVSLLEQMLQDAGYSSIASTLDPSKVCELHRKNRYDLILLDLQMPGMDGFQVMENLKEIETDGYLPVIVITAQPDHKLRVLEAGAKDFISKPFDLSEVMLRVHNMLEVRLLHRESKRIYGYLQTVNEDLQAFSYSISHDLRAPLRHIIGFVDLLQRNAGPSLSEKNHVYLETISEAATRMGGLIDDLLTFSRVGHAELQKTEVNLDELVRDTLGDFQAETKERSIMWNIQPLPSVRADHALLRMVFVNLISNAIKFTGACTETKIEIGCQSAKNTETVVFIRDNGVGFDPGNMEKLFGVFQRLHSQNEFKGTGIGLANVQRIINRHGGRTWAEGKVNGGATFYFSIPQRNGVTNER